MGKRYFLLLLVIFLILTGCSKISTPKGGYFDNSKYKNDTIGMAIVFPESWIITLDGGVELQLNRDISEQLEEKDHELMPHINHENCLAYFVASKYPENTKDVLNCGLMLHIEEYMKGSIQYKHQYIEQAKGQLEKSFQTVIIEMPVENIDEISFTKYSYKKFREGKMVQRITYIGFVDDFAVIITLKYFGTDNEAKTELNQIIETINFNN